MRKVFMCFVAAFLFLGILAQAQTSDTTPPKLTGLSFTPTSIDVSATGQTVVSTLQITDDLAGVSGVWIYYRGPANQELSAWAPRIAGTALNGTYQSQTVFPRYSQPGTWVAAVRMSDSAGNWVYLDSAKLTELAFPTQLTVSSNPADITPPVLAGVEFIPSTLNVSSAPQQMKIRYHVKDDMAGTMFAPPPETSYNTTWAAVIVSPTGKQHRWAATWQFALVQGDRNDGYWEATIDMPQYSEAGTWHLEFLGVQDLAANRRYYYYSTLLSELGTQVQFNVTSSPSDITPPTLLTLDFEPKVINTSIGPQWIKVRLGASDDLAGIEFSPTNIYGSYFECGVGFRSPSGQQNRDAAAFAQWNLLSGSSLNGTWETTLYFPQYSEEGTWRVHRTELKDKPDNHSVYSSSQLEGMGLPVALVVTKPSLIPDGTIDPKAGGTVKDTTFGDRAQVIVPPNLLKVSTSVAIDVFSKPLDVAIPKGFQAPGTFYVNIYFDPEPAWPLPSPGLTIILPLTSPRIPGSSLHLYRIDPATGNLVQALDVLGKPVIGTVDKPDGMTATFKGISRLSTVVGLVPVAIPVTIDLRPGETPNPVNLKSNGLVSVAVLGSAALNVRTIDVTKLFFGPGNAQPAHKLLDPLVYADHLKDVNGDGLTDLVLHIVQREIGLAPDATQVCLYGETLLAIPITGCDSVKITP